MMTTSQDRLKVKLALFLGEKFSRIETSVDMYDFIVGVTLC